jgi:hypothetical protein
VIIVVSTFLIVGCALGKLGVSYVAQENAKAVKGADAVVVEVSVEDLQPAEPLWHSSLRVADAANTLKGATETELKDRGFRIGGGGALVAIQLVRFDARLQPEGSAGVTNVSRSVLEMRVQVQEQDGKILYSREVEGEGRAGGIYVIRESAPELQESLAGAFQRLFADPTFTAAILATRKP